MNLFLDRIRENREYGEIIKHLKENENRAKKYPFLVTGLCEGALDVFLASCILEKNLGSHLALLCVPDEKTAARLLHSLCEFGLRAAIYQGNTKIRARLYMEVTGTMPETATVNAILFMRKDQSPYNFNQSYLQTVQPNVWTELVFDAPAEYVDANYFTVAFNVRNYANCNSDVTMKIYIETLAFTNTLNLKGWENDTTLQGFVTKGLYQQNMILLY